MDSLTAILAEGTAAMTEARAIVSRLEADQELADIVSRAYSVSGDGSPLPSLDDEDYFVEYVCPELADVPD